MEYIYNKGYVYNDLNANNVILDWRDDEFCFIFIDFGKSEEISKVEGYKRGVLNYIVFEVIFGEKESSFSDIYLFGKMFEVAVFGRSFCVSFKEVISETIVLFVSDRFFIRKVFVLFVEV